MAFTLNSLVPLISAIVSVFIIFISIYIFKKVYQEKFKRPWLFIGISTIFLAISQILTFLNGFNNLFIISADADELIIYLIEFISISILAYGLVLEFLIIGYYKGKFVKMKFIPVQEGTIGGEIDLNVSNGSSYFAFKKDRKFLLEQFAMATKKGFEGFLISSDNPKLIREEYKIFKTPIAWITQIENSQNSKFVKESLDENSDVVDPLQLNNIISFVDNFLEQAKNPFILFDLNSVLKVNNFSIVLEFLKYISSKCDKSDGILICMLNLDMLNKSELSEIETVFKNLE